MDRKLITKRQKQLLKVIYNYIKDSGFPPSFSDLKEELNVSSNQSIIDLLSALKKKRFIKREEGSARAIKILSKGFEVLGKRSLIPYAGESFAGSLTETLEEVGQWREIKGDALKIDNLFFVKVNGDSMIGAGINDGDIVLVEKTREFVSGDIVLAQNFGETTIKRFIFQEGSRPFLEPANPAYRPIYITEKIQIIGKIVGVVKSNGIKRLKNNSKN